MKIIAGEFKGKRIKSLNGKYTRPTSNKVREAIFNILSYKIKSSNVLDLFAGTGSLGIEALSRGAKTSIFVDLEKKVISNIKQNIFYCNLNNVSYIFRWNILKNLNCLKKIKNYFDIVFIDPPYNKKMIDLCLKNLVKTNKLKPGSIIVVEHSIKEIILINSFEFDLAEQKNYGKTTVSFLISKI